MRHAHLVRSLQAIGVLAAVVATPSCDTGPAASAAQLAFHYAPVIYQDIDDTNMLADFITSFDYDGDMYGPNNWDNLRGNVHAAVYYSVVEGDQHWFITYGFFHPRDWTDDVDTEHENDMEGALAIVQKGGTYGTLQAMITVFHLDFFTWKPEGSPASNAQEDIDGELPMEDVDGVSHPALQIEAEGHGVKVLGEAGDFDGSPGEDGVIYTPALSPLSHQTLPRGDEILAAQYKLINIFPTLWAEQMKEAETPEPTFDHFGTFEGNKSGGCGGRIPVICEQNAANAPWGWDDTGAPFSEDDGPIAAGELALDPIHVAHWYLSGIAVDSEYVCNQYIEDLRNAGFGIDKLPWGWPPGIDMTQELFAKMKAQGPADVGLCEPTQVAVNS